MCKMIKKVKRFFNLGVVASLPESELETTVTTTDENVDTVVYEVPNSKYTAEYFRSPKNKKWYFRIRHQNTNVVASSRQAYSNEEDCVEVMENLIAGLFGAKIVDVTEKR